MGFLSYLFDIEWDERADIDRLQHRARAARLDRSREKRALEARMTAIEREIGEIALFCRTAIEVMIEKGVVKRAEFIEHLRAIDARDGVEDGKLAPGSRDIVSG